MRAIQRKPLYEWLSQSSVSVGLRYVCIAARVHEPTALVLAAMLREPLPVSRGRIAMNFGLLVSQLPHVRELHVDYDIEQSRPA
jgi:hypothetical protein